MKPGNSTMLKALRGGWSEKTLSATAILTEVADSDRYIVGQADVDPDFGD